MQSVGMLLCDGHPKWDDFPHMAAVFVDVPVVVYRACDGVLPDLDAHDAFLVSGSSHSVHGAAPWHGAVRAFLRSIARAPHKRAVGLCYGAQAIALALGGAVGPQPDGVFRFGIEEVEVNRTAVVRHPSLTPLLTTTAPLRLGTCHGEQATALPVGATTVAASSVTPHEMFVVGTHANLLGVQCHPEVATATLAARVAPALVDRGALTTTRAAEDTAALNAEAGDGDVVAWAVRAFLHLPQRSPSQSRVSPSR
tara:strand:- start:5131 stop:5889 length:759 start_codon:yes stop_codon:yes gene_type:complete